MKEQPEAFSVQFLNVINYRFSRDNRLYLMLVLKGNVRLSVAGATPLKVNKGQVQVINRNSDWQLDGDQDNMVIVVALSPLWLFSGGEGLAHSHFSLGNTPSPWQASRLNQLISHIAILWLKKNNDTWRLEVNKALLDILCILTQHFSCAPPAVSATGFSPRVSKVIALIEERYREKLALQQVAAQLHITVSHLSRQFASETGMNFRAFLTGVRFNHAVREIALTTQPIGAIVSDSGFSSFRRFSALFRQRYGTHPSAWRHDVKAGNIPFAGDQKLLDQGTSDTRQISPMELFSLLSANPGNAPLTPALKNDLRSEQIHLQPGAASGTVAARHYVIAVGSFDELLKQHIQQQLICLKERFPDFQVEVGDPLSDTFIPRNIYTGEISPTWSPWSNLDIACNFLKRLGISPMIRLAPEAASLLNSEHLVQLREFITHNILLLGREYVQSWSFILDMRSLKMLQTAKRLTLSQTLLDMVRHLLPACRIGLTLCQREDYEQLLSGELIEQIDFIGLSVSPNEQHDFSSAPDYTPPENHYVIRQQLEGMIRLFRKHGVHSPLYLQSWSTLTGNTLMTNGLFFRGALLMDMLLSLPEEVSMLGLWLNSELQNEVSSAQVIENNSLSLFFIATTKRPIFHIITLKERLQGAVFSSGPNWVATREGNTYRLLLLNPVTINPLLSVQEHLLNDYGKRFSVRFSLEQTGIWRIKQWMFDQKNGALYYQYGLHPTLYDRDEETMHYISQRSEPTLSVRDERIPGHWVTDIVMDINAVCFLELVRVAD
ncbi:helix-turn-helix domain-containing protein [Entomohabitans teleogrylli]|uniref:helix-turn-helix domain-containing protein n=1 Tax=Entomohabitans teleogrylli TaxID=1384589 RepID=UPI00073D395B|nr:helix-turn-helix domain-containing protein [Entomohabitans teleogrylli]